MNDITISVEEYKALIKTQITFDMMKEYYENECQSYERNKLFNAIFGYKEVEE